VRLTPAAVDKAVALSHQFGRADAIASGYFDELVPPDDVVERATAVARAALSLNAPAHAASKERTRAPAIAAIARAIQADDDDFDRWMAVSGR
jgi:enoyl-CoA hydratase/carnithine racemase